MSSVTCFLAGNLQIDAAPWVLHEHTVACRAKGDVTLGHAALFHSSLSHSLPSYSAATACPLSNGLKLRSCISPLQHVSIWNLLLHCCGVVAQLLTRCMPRKMSVDISPSFRFTKFHPYFAKAKAAIDTRRSHTHTHSHQNSQIDLIPTHASTGYNM